MCASCSRWPIVMLVGDVGCQRIKPKYQDSVCHLVLWILTFILLPSFKLKGVKLVNPASKLNKWRI